MFCLVFPHVLVIILSLETLEIFFPLRRVLDFDPVGVKGLMITNISNGIKIQLWYFAPELA